MGIVLPPGGRLCADSLDAAVVDSSDNDSVVVDLGSASFFDPAGLVVVAATAERAIERGAAMTVVPPTSLSVQNYLVRMRLPEVLNELGVSTDSWRAVRPRDLHEQLAELHAFRSESELGAIVDKIVDIFARFDRVFAQPLYNSLYEFGLNAVQHSKPGDEDGTGYVAVQTYPNRRDVAFAVADAGQGLRRSLSATTAVPSDTAAVGLAARKHLSSVDDVGRGRGITGVIELTGRHRGSVTMLSGDAMGEFSNGHWDPRVSRLANPFLGTLAQTRLAFEGRLEV